MYADQMSPSFSHFSRFIALTLALVACFALSQPAHSQDTGDKDPIQLFYKGQEAHERGELQAALKLYEEAIEAVSEFPEAEFQRGSILLQLGRKSDAEAAFRRAIELRHDWTLPMASLGSLLVGSDRLDEAESVLLNAVSIDPQNFPALYALTELYLKRRSGPDTLNPLLSKIRVLTLKANPPVSMWIARGLLERATGETDHAKASFLRGLETDPENRTALFELAYIFLESADHARAAALAVRLTELEPESADTAVLKARILLATGKGAEALKVLDAVTEKNPVLLELRDKIFALTSEDVPELEKRLAIEPKSPALLGRLCTVLRTREPSKAVEYCRRGVEAEPDSIEALIRFGAALVQAGRQEASVTVLRRVLEIEPGNYTARANLATALFQLRRFEEAKREYLWITNQQPDLAIAYYFLAIAHDNLQEYADALANYQKFLRLASETENKLEIERVNLRLESLQKQVRNKKGKGNER